MQVATFLAAYHPGMDGDYSVTWAREFDIPLYALLSRSVGMTMAEASYLHITKAVVTINADLAGAMRDPITEVPVKVAYRINDIPAVMRTTVPFFAEDIETLEPYVEPAPLPC